MSETTKQGSLTGPQAWDWVNRSIWTDRMLAALDNGVKGRKWFSLIDKVYRPQTLFDAWQKVRENKGAAGVDGQSVQRFEQHQHTYLHELSDALKDGTYRPEAIRRVEIPKPGGKRRPLGIPTVKDRIVQTAVKQTIEPIFEHQFRPMSYGFRPGRGCKDALREVHDHLKAGYTHAVDADLQGYFDSIPHDRLMAKVEEYISDGRLLDLIGRWLKQDILAEMEKWTPEQGTPQGAIISPLLANLYLHGLDVRMTEKGYRMVRYADDFVILCQSADDAEAALRDVRAWTDAEGLTLHPEKTQIGDCRVPGQGFDFLGYRFEAGRRLISRKSLKAYKAKIRANTRRTEGKSLYTVLATIRPIQRGWFEYFQHTRPWIFRHLDQFTRRRLRAMLRKQARRPGSGQSFADSRRWPNKFFAAAGLFTLTEAHRLASQPR